MKAATLIFITIGLIGCGSTSELIIDHSGIDEGKYSLDLAECTKHRPVITADHPDAKCMRAKGYKVLVSHA